MTTLLVPCAGKSTRYPGVRPKWMLTTPDGQLAVQKAIASVHGAESMRRIIAIRKDHDDNFGAMTALRRAFGDTVEIIVIDHDTNGPAETVELMLKRGGVKGAFMIKDADSFFEPVAPTGAAFVTVSDLRECLDMSRVGAKSFITINEQGVIAAIVEKQVVSNYVSVGLYAFEDAASYLGWIDQVRTNEISGEIFVSHVVSHAIAEGEIFRPHQVREVIDVGTLADWVNYVSNHRMFLVDIDGVVFRNQSEYFPPYWGDEVDPIVENVEKLRQVQAKGAQLIFVTSRPEKYRDATMQALGQVGLVPYALVMGAAHASRVLINDFAPSNPYPSAQAINLIRNSGDLPRYLP